MVSATNWQDRVLRHHYSIGALQKLKSLYDVAVTSANINKHASQGQLRILSRFSLKEVVLEECHQTNILILQSPRLYATFKLESSIIYHTAKNTQPPGFHN